VNVDTLMAAMPGLTRDEATQYLPLMEAAMAEYGITTELRSAMWLAQAGHESLSLTYFEEIADGSAYEGREDLGNTEPGDGQKYKGRGPIQVTGRYNYTDAAGALDLPLVDQPDMAADPPHAFRISAWWWETHGLNPISDTGDVVAATQRINGGTTGLADRESRYALARGLGAAVVPGHPMALQAPGDDVFIRSSDGRTRWFIASGKASYWRLVPEGAEGDVADRAIEDPNDTWLGLWDH
jgi:putative chitinase